MKKILLFASALAGLFLAASCQQENLEPQQMDGTVKFTVEAPGAIATKTIADGKNVDVVHYAVYKTNSNETHAIEVPTERPLAQGFVPMSEKKANIEFNLLQDQKYTVIFWAQVSQDDETGQNDYYELGDLRAISMKKDAQNNIVGNEEARAAFFAWYSFETYEHKDHVVTLKRPFAQLNLLTTLESLTPTQTGQTTGYTIDIEKSTVTVEGLTSTFYPYAQPVLDGTQGKAEETNETFTFTLEDTPAVQGIGEGDNKDLLKVNGNDYHYVSMNYFFVPVDEYTVNLTYGIKTDKGSIENTVVSVPVKKNFRTNVIGNLLTKESKFEIIVDEAFNEPAEEVEVVSVSTATELVEALKAANDAETTVVVNLAEGTYKFPTLSGNVVLNCAEGTVFTGTSGLNINGATVIGATFENKDGVAVSGTIYGTFKNCTFDGSETLRWCYSTAGKEVVFEDCEIKTDFRGFHFDGMDGNVIFRRCKINGFNAYGGEGTATFENCVFGNDESTYNGLNTYSNTVLKDCQFNFISGKTNFIDMEGTGKTMTINNCTATLDGVAKPVTDFVGGSKINQNTVILDGKVYASSVAGLIAAVKQGVTVVTIKDGNYEFPIGTEIDFRGKTITIVGSENVVFDVTKVDARDQFVTGATLKFEGVKLNFGKANYMGFANTASLTYKNCDINGLQFLFGPQVVFEGCSLNSNGAEHSVWTYGAKNVTFTDCDFTYGDRAVNCYSDNDGGKQTVNFTDCTFATSNTASEGAVEINSCFFSVGIEVNMDGCTAPAYGQMAYVSPWDSTDGAKTTINIK